MQSSASKSKSKSVILPAVASMINVELCFRNFCLALGSKASINNVSKLIIDMKSCEFVEVASLMFLISLIQKRTKEGLETLFCLPREKRVRDFFRVWGLQGALEKVTNRRFYDLMSSDIDKQYFGESEDVDNLFYAGIILQDDSGTMQRLMSERFFAITNINVDKRNVSESDVVKIGTQLSLRETNRWRESLIYYILKKHLGDPAEYVHSRIIYETITNSLRHSNADIVQTASVLQKVKRIKYRNTLLNKSAKENMPGNFNHGLEEKIPAEQFIPLLTIVVRDDGLSMIDTLKIALQEGKEIRTLDDVELINYYYVHEKEGEELPDESVLTSLYTPEINSRENDFLVSTIFPGISCDIEGYPKWHSPENGRGQHHDKTRDYNKMASAGMGLHILINTVVDVFHGEVSFRTKNYFMNIRRSTIEDARYRVKIREYTPSCFDFLGNMVTIRLPLMGQCN